MWRNITIEPVVAMYFLVGALSINPGQEMFLRKVCFVNLNHSMEIYDNIQDHEEEQITTQKLVLGVQVTYIIITSIITLVY